MSDLQQFLGKRKACHKAIEWVGDRDLATAWQECERPDWMLWLCGNMQGSDGWPTVEEIVLVVCDCAESILAIFEKKYPHDARPRNAIATARAWAEGKASIEEVRSAAPAARTAAYIAGNTAAYTVIAATDDAWSSARNKKMADLVRKRLKVPNLPTKETP